MVSLSLHHKLPKHREHENCSPSFLRKAHLGGQAQGGNLGGRLWSTFLVS
ncbi:hypothetical protein Fmac_018153 [Flemingia macrophylla]|uniref:Uncharacterized protein n=1 Tax=Flemingia macrophylla TaxID=520843 RepID=A0ABD1M4L2_9FABA